MCGVKLPFLFKFSHGVDSVKGAIAGLRRDEAVGLQRRDFDRTASVLTIARIFTHGEVSTPKTEGSAREVALPEFLAVELGAYADRQRVVSMDGWLFPNRNGRPQFNNVERWWNALRQRLAARALEPARAETLRRLRIHDLRHTAVTLLSEVGVDARTTAAQVGHKGIAMTSHYTHPSMRAKQAAMALLPVPKLTMR